MFARGQWSIALLLATAAHAGLISQLAPLPLSGSEHAGDQGLELNIQLQAPQSLAPQVRATPEPTVATSKPAPPRRASVKAPKPAAKQSTKARANRPARTGSAQGTSDYYAKLQVWLNAHKHYPTEARHQGWEGVTELEFVVQADGTVAWSRLARSSGYLMLDDAAARLLAEAQPLPKPPAELDAAGRHVRVPISYRLY